MVALESVTRSDILGKCPLFADFTATGLQILASIANERTFAEGTPIFVEDQPGEALYVIRDGHVRLSLAGPDGREQTLGALGPGEHFGELALLVPGATRFVTATAQGDVGVLEIRQRDFARLQMQKPQACLKLILSIASEFGRKLGENRQVLRAALQPARR